MRLQAFHIVVASGAKLANGGDIAPEDLWQLPSDTKRSHETFSLAETPIELRNRLLEKFKNG